MALLNSPRLTQCSRFVEAANSADASSFSAITAISIPWLRAPSSTRNGNRPFPAMSPQPVVFASVMTWLRLLDDAPLCGLDKTDEFRHIRGIRQRSAHFAQSLVGIQIGRAHV